MERYYLNAEDFSCKNCKNDSVQIPSCINDDFCTMSPMSANNGVLAMAFVNMQPIEGIYSDSDAFCRGTLFENLDMPFKGGFKK